MKYDFVLDWIKQINITAPPFCVEMVLRDGSRHFLHSFNTADEESMTLVLRIWDFRALSPEEVEEIKTKLNEIQNQEDLAKEHRIHPKLDWANLRVHFEDIAYCIEWHDRLWPGENREKIGFGGTLEV